MDHAVGLVQAYLRINGYFTVTEYPVVVPLAGGGYRTATDLDLLALRFPHAGAPSGSAGGSESHPSFARPDPALGVQAGQPDMLIAEVKEGRAELNAGATRPEVLSAVLSRFGCCDEPSAADVAERLRREGKAVLPNGHPVRLAAFGTSAGEGGGKYLRLTHANVLRFLQDYVRRYWSSLYVGETKDPALGFLLLQEKARRSRPG
jgi:hypothetical protein